MVGTIHHHGIVVDDLEASVAFYVDHFDLEEEYRITAEPAGFGTLLGVDRPAPAEIAFLRDETGMRVELEEHTTAERTVDELADPTDVGYAHLCFEVDDIDATYDELVAAGVEFVTRPGTATDSGAHIVYCRDPSGNLLELIELPDGPNE